MKCIYNMEIYIYIYIHIHNIWDMYCINCVSTVMYHTCLHNSLYNLEGLSFKYYISHKISAKIICVMYIYNMYVYNQSSKG